MQTDKLQFILVVVAAMIVIGFGTVWSVMAISKACIRVREFRTARARNRTERRYNEGWNYAAGTLLRGDQPHDMSDSPYADEFDAGIEAACMRFRKCMGADD